MLDGISQSLVNIAIIILKCPNKATLTSNYSSYGIIN